MIQKFVSQINSAPITPTQTLFQSFLTHAKTSHFKLYTPKMDTQLQRSKNLRLTIRNARSRQNEQDYCCSHRKAKPHISNKIRRKVNNICIDRSTAESKSNYQNAFNDRDEIHNCKKSISVFAIADAFFQA